MKIVIPGGTGHVGTFLARDFAVGGHEVVVLSRNAKVNSRRPNAPQWRIVPWDGETLGDWAAEIDGADVVVNLAGRSVNCRYGAENRRLIMDSRIRSTRVLGKAIAAAARRAAGLAAIKHGHHLLPSLRRAQRRGDRHPGRHGSVCARHVAIQYRRRQVVGTSAQRSRRSAHAKGAAPLGIHAEPGPRWAVRLSVDVGSLGTGRGARRWAPICFLDS